jgi:hypothetical protein
MNDKNVSHAEKDGNRKDKFIEHLKKEAENAVRKAKAAGSHDRDKSGGWN